MRGVVYLTADNIRRTDSEAEEIMDKDIKERGVESVGEMATGQRVQFVKKLKAKGLTNSQIIGLTWLSKSKVTGI